MSMTRLEAIEPKYPAASPSEGEEEQAEAAFASVLAQLSPRFGFRREVRELAQALFELGWIAGVRTGHTWPSLMNVPLPDGTVQEVMRDLVGAVAGVPPRLGQKVRYEGSMTGRHGNYWIAHIEARLSLSGRPKVHYSLGEVRNGLLRPVLHNVHAESLTPLPEDFDRDTL
ncbi:hypothetical protein [Streptomyces melanogenes]|uniref:hypothetical protein n=1 Tax=Streptomyces melanogenes TaxID=67326 RepID=UPI00167CEFB6|nr:hypothetical protein [Streptomyces melanogenes]GGP80928.1 hypothetical protein GCM10010278_69360 [Streptomyces melanogenes]